MKEIVKVNLDLPLPINLALDKAGYSLGAYLYINLSIKLYENGFL